MSSNNKKPALGRGLSALLQNAKTDITTKQSGEATPVVGTIALIKIKDIDTNPFQPRTNFEETSLQELSESIKQHGIIQPITVRKLGYDKYQLISGERRFRASQLANLEEIPAYIRVANDQAMLEMGLIAAMLMQRFRLEWPEGAAWPKANLGVTLRPATPMLLKMTAI